MKVCCDRCDKALKMGFLGDTIGGRTITINSIIHDEHLLLCKHCYNEFRNFLDNKNT